MDNKHLDFCISTLQLDPNDLVVFSFEPGHISMEELIDMSHYLENKFENNKVVFIPTTAVHVSGISKDKVEDFRKYINDLLDEISESD